MDRDDKMFNSKYVQTAESQSVLKKKIHSHCWRPIFPNEQIPNMLIPVNIEKGKYPYLLMPAKFLLIPNTNSCTKPKKTLMCESLWLLSI